MEKSFKEALEFRHACKIFDNTKKINDEDIRYILEAARKTPTSFGMEAWKFLVITNDELKAKLKPFCYNQEQITSCSHLVILLAGLNKAKITSGEPQKRFAKKGFNQEMQDAYLDMYKQFHGSRLEDDEKLFEWSARQTYIALGNMMTAAAIKGIDSCPIEGFDKNKIEEILNLDKKEYQVSIILPFGYRIKEQPPIARENFENIFEFIN